MTTEIAVSNRLGIALATDSAVTIGGGLNEKVFDTADKLFELSPVYAVALMINGNMDCLGVPWEILVKDFREAEGSVPRSTIKDWTDDFLSFVVSYDALSKIKSDEIIKGKVEDLCSGLKNDISDGLLAAMRDGAHPKIKSGDDFKEAVKNYLLSLISEMSDFFEEAGKTGSLSDISPEELSTSYEYLRDDFFVKQFYPHEISLDELLAIRQLASKLILPNITTDYTTGIVVAGYGCKSTFPAIDHVEVEGKVCNHLKYSRVNSYAIEDAEDAGQVVSYAQTDVIERLLGGADPTFVKKSASFIKEAIVEAGTSIEEALRPKRVSKKKLADRLRALEEVGEIFRQKYLDEAAPQLIKASTAAFDRMIALMPKQELVNLAEALVSITAVERKASSDMGTVGGPIDVALITKHEGFVWIKRKQHFDPNLNPRYFWRRYGKNLGGGGYGAGTSWAEGSAEGAATSQQSGAGS